MGTAVPWLGFEPVRLTGRPTTHPDALRARIDSCRPFPTRAVQPVSQGPPGESMHVLRQGGSLRIWRYNVKTLP